MCGIVGYIGQKEATPVLINALKKLEYRGYDSAGIAVLMGKTLLFAKQRVPSNFLKKELLTKQSRALLELDILAGQLTENQAILMRIHRQT